MTVRPTRAIPRTLLALSVLAGVALWLTPAAFDLVIARSGRVMRVAMLPPPWQLPIFVLAAALAIAALASLLPKTEAEPSRAPGPVGTPHDTDARVSSDVRDPFGPSASRSSAADVLLPVAALGLLALPYLPWLADALPILRVLAGPGRALVWFTVAVLIARGFWRAIPRRARLTNAPPRRVALALLVLGTLIDGATGAAFTRTILFPGGDEPHYLIIAQSLWRDGDLKIENNHRRGDYREYFEGDLRPHYLTRGVDREIYSIHPIGVSVLLVPVYAIGGYGLVVWALAAMASGAGALAWLAAWRATGSRGAAAVAWLACCVNGPWVLNSFAVYPEVPAALMVMCAWLCLHASGIGARTRSLRWLACGAAIATLPWLSTKYAPMAFALMLVGLGRIWWPEHARDEAASVAPDAALTGTDAVLARTRDASAVDVDAAAARANPLLASCALIVPFAISLAAWFTFFYVIWGTFSPSAPYGSQRETRLAYLLAGGPGLLFDQEYGLLAFVPALLLALTGLVAMLAARGRARRLALEILLVFGALLGTVGAFHIWWGGSATVGRPIIAGLLLLAIPFAWRYEQQRAKPTLRAAYHVLIVGGIAIGLTLALAQGGLLLAAHRSGVSRVLEWLSPTWTLWTIAPTFIAQPPLAATGTALLWIVTALAAAWWLHRRPRTLTPGRATLTALAACTVALLVISIIIPLTGLRAADPRVLTERSGTDEDDDDEGDGRARTASELLASRLRARSRSELLDRFDAARRPIAIAYDPWSRLDPMSAPSLVELVARPTDRRPRPPIPLLYNARWTLPAGRYTVELIAGSGDERARTAATDGSITGSLGLYLGYSGLSTRQWEVSMGVPGVWGRTFDLLTDVNVVGFRASPEIERAAPTLRLTPQAIVDVHARLQPSEVTSSALLGDTTVYFHDARVHAEGEGFWTPGASTMMLTMTASRTRAAVLGLRAGPMRTAVELVVQGWRERVLLEPGGERRVTLPATSAGVMRLFIETSTGFVPADVDPASGDRRMLGVWVTIPRQER